MERARERMGKVERHSVSRGSGRERESRHYCLAVLLRGEGAYRARFRLSTHTTLTAPKYTKIRANWACRTTVDCTFN